MAAIDGRLSHRLFLAVCQSPAMCASWLSEPVGGDSIEVSRRLKRFVDTGSVAVFNGRQYLLELGMRRAANTSRVLPDIIGHRHGAYLDRWYREHEHHHDDVVSQLVVCFPTEGVDVLAGWRGEVKILKMTPISALPQQKRYFAEVIAANKMLPKNRGIGVAGGMSRMAKQELLAAIQERYRGSSKRDKTRILDEFIAVTGHHRKHAIRLCHQIVGQVRGGRRENQRTPRSAHL